MPIFDARTWSALKVTKVQREIAVTQYEKAIQNAFREVADALAVRGTVDQQVAAQQSLVDAVAETYRLSNIRYDKGIDSYLSVLDAQRSLYAAQQGLVALRLAKLANQVQTLRRPGRRRRLALGRTRPESRRCPRKQGRQNVVGQKALAASCFSATLA